MMDFKTMLEECPDKKELEKWIDENVNVPGDGYGNGHEWFAVTGISPADFTKMVRALKKAENISPSYETSIDIGKDGHLVLQCNTAKDHEQNLLTLLEDEAFSQGYNAVYWQDCWDYPDNLELDTGTCEITCFNIFEADSPGYWDVDMTIRDRQSDAEFELGGGCITSEQAKNLLMIAYSITKASEYETNIADDFGFLYEDDLQQD